MVPPSILWAKTRGGNQTRRGWIEAGTKSLLRLRQATGARDTICQLERRVRTTAFAWGGGGGGGGAVGAIRWRLTRSLLFAIGPCGRHSAHTPFSLQEICSKTDGQLRQSRPCSLNDVLKPVFDQSTSRRRFGKASRRVVASSTLPVRGRSSPVCAVGLPVLGTDLEHGHWRLFVSSSVA